jgi:hypothetical protein
LPEPEDHDFPSAADYLGLLADPQTVTALIGRLRSGALEHEKAKDLLRTARLPLLPADNPHVVADLAKVKKGQPPEPRRRRLAPTMDTGSTVTASSR